MLYRNRIKRKQFVLETSTKAKRYFKKAITSIESFIDKHRTLYDIICRQIKEGLDYGFTKDIKYYIYQNSIYNPSIEAEYTTYHGHAAEESVYELLFDVLANELLPNEFSKYTDLEIITGEDQDGKYFEVKLID